MTSSSSSGNLNQQPRPVSRASDILTHSVQESDISDPRAGCSEQKQESEQALAPGDQLQVMPSSLDSATNADEGENEETVITSIRATGVALGLGRIPAGFHAVVHHSGLEWRTENNRLSANEDVVEWDGLMSIPADLSATVCFGIYASFEFQPMLGDGEQLQKLTVTVEQLLNHSAEVLPFTFSPQEDVGSTPSSLFVTVGRGKWESAGPSVSRVLTSHCSTTESRGQLENATNEGHSALSRYRKHGDRRDLERSIEQYQLALDICSHDHPCRAAAQSNMAMAKFIQCQVDDADLSLDVPLDLYRDALSARPIGHLDRPSTLIQLAAVHFVRFEKRRDEVDRVRAEGLLHEAMNLSSAESHENRAAISMLQLYARREVGPVQAGAQSSVERNSVSGSTDEDPWTSSDNLLGSFERSGDLGDLQEAISLLEICVRSASVRDRRYPTGLTNLGVALLYRFYRLRAQSDLEEAISKLGDGVDLTPNYHPDKPGYLNNLGNSFKARFERHGELRDLDQAISRQGDAVDLTPDGHPHKPAFLISLGSSILTRFQRLGELCDLEQAISRLRDAVGLTPDDHSRKPALLNNLSHSFTRFERLGELCDLEQAISRLGDAVNLTPEGHPLKPTLLNNLSKHFLARFKHVGELGDLEQAISRLGDAVDLTPDGHPDKPGRLNNLGNSILTRFECLGELHDLEKAISRLRDAANATPDDHPHKPALLNNLGNTFATRFRRLGELGDLQEAILRLGDATNLTPDGHPDKPALLSNLGNSFRARFDRLGDLSDVEQAISRQRDAVDLAPDGHPRKHSLLNNLGNSFGARFGHLGELDDLEQAISKLVDAVDLTPDGHPDKPGHLNGLGNSFLTRFSRLGKLEDLEHAISRQGNAVDLTPDGHPDKPALLNNLGHSFLTRFERLGKLGNLQQAISKQGGAVDLTPDGHPDKPALLNNLGHSFLTRFERLGDLGDLEQAISRVRDAIDLTPDGHPNKPAWLNTLGRSFGARFQRLGELGDLEQAILRLRDAVNLTSDGHPDKPGRLNKLGDSLLVRSMHLGELGDVEHAISRQRDAVDLTPDGHPDKSGHLNSLGNSLRARFHHLGEVCDIQQAVSRLRDAVDLAPDDHPDKPDLLNNLGGCLFTRFECLDEICDLEEAISMLGDAVDLTPDGHSRKPALLNNLGNSFITRFERHGEPCDLEQAISRFRDAVYFSPFNHSAKSLYLRDLGDSLLTRFQRLGELGDRDQAISLYSHAACASTGSTPIRFRASQDWISCARASGHHSLLHAYSYAISLLPQLAWIGLSLTYRYHELTQAADMVREAAAAALDSGRPELAVEWLEQGRSIVWGELFQLRSSHDELSAMHPDHAHRLRELSVALENAGAAREKSLSSPSELTETLEEETNRHRALAIERDKLLQEIRLLPGFERFLLYNDFSQLCASAHSGPVVILNAAKSRCDALIVLADMDNVIHVPLPNFTLERLESLQTSLKSLVRREGKSMPQEHPSEWEPILSALWKCVVKPVLHSLAISIIDDLSHIFWCPTGPFTFLPIHAAGFYLTEYSRPGHKVSDFVVSSYIPTLSILVPPPRLDAASGGDLRFLAVRQPPSDGLSKLPGVHAELEHIKGVIQSSPSARTTLVESSLGTVEEVLELMKEADWAHFACHGIQDAANPTDSGLCLADGRRLKLPDIITLSRPRGGLAFLSACQTATGDKKLSDEAIHIAAGMLFAGYGGVVGTMWSISDRLAPHVARDVYEHLFRKGTKPDYREAARALQDAVRGLRDSGASFKEWLPFIHVGL